MSRLLSVRWILNTAKNRTEEATLSWWCCHSSLCVTTAGWGQGGTWAGLRWCQPRRGGRERVLPDHWCCEEKEGSGRSQAEEGRGSRWSPGGRETGHEEGMTLSYPSYDLLPSLLVHEAIKNWCWICGAFGYFVLYFVEIPAPNVYLYDKTHKARLLKWKDWSNRCHVTLVMSCSYTTNLKMLVKQNLTISPAYNVFLCLCCKVNYLQPKVH